MTSPRSLRWGVIFISAGVLWLLVSADIISPYVFEYLFYLWPVFLIAVGIELVFRGTKLKTLAYISPLLLAAVAFFAGQEAYYIEQNYNRRKGGSFAYEVPAGKTLQARIELGDYDLYVRAKAGGKIRGRMTGAHPSPKVTFTDTDETTVVDVRDNPALFSRGWGEFHRVLNASSSRYPELRVDLPQNTPVKLTLEGERSNADLNLADVSLTELIANIDEVALSLELGASRPLVDVTLNGTGNRLLLQLPGGAGVRIDGAGIRSNLSSLGLEKSGDAYRTPGYDTLKPQIHLRLQEDLDRLAIRTY